MRRLSYFVCAVVLQFMLMSCAYANEDSLKIATISDVHYLSSELVGDGKAYDSYKQNLGRDVDELHSALDVAIDNIKREKVDILLVTGDITNHGEKQSHLDFIDILRELKQSGIRTFVIPGNHDINIPDAKSYLGDVAQSVDNISSEEFAELYSEFGYGNALSRDEASLSYLAELDEHTWLLAFDTNRYDEYQTSSISAGRIKPETMRWALEIIEKGKQEGKRVLAMMHHGLIEHMPYQSALFQDYLVEDWAVMADRLAASGLEVVFTGHFHSNDVVSRKDNSGNVIYDVETASLAQYPFGYRIMNLTANELSIKTYFVDSLPSNKNFGAEHKKKLEDRTRALIKIKLDGYGPMMPDDLKNSLVEMLTKLSVSHVEGDEKPNPLLVRAIKSFASQLGTSVGDDYSLDFPPSDSNLTIEFADKKSFVDEQ